MNKQAVDDDDMGAFWRDVNGARQKKRAYNRLASPAQLKRAGIAYEDKNGGAHLICKFGPLVADFWPGTGKWIFRDGGKTGRGVFNLIRKFGASAT